MIVYFNFVTSLSSAEILTRRDAGINQSRSGLSIAERAAPTISLNGPVAAFSRIFGRFLKKVLAWAMPRC
jgi:hypothetical protein